MSLKKAENLSEIYRAFQSYPLRIEEIDDFYQETKVARGENPRQRLKRLLENHLDFDQHILFVGYKGCGKSTELNHLQRDLQNDFLVLNYSVQEELDPVHINYIELFIVAMERLFTIAKDQGLKIRAEYLKSIQHWTQSKEIEEIKEKYNIGIEGEVGAEGNYGIPYFQKFFYKFKASAKSSRSLKETLRQNIEPRLSELITFCNQLITEIRLDLNRIGKKDILMIIEDLDKIPLDRAEHLFFRHGNQLTQLRTNVIYTFPIALYHNIKLNQIKTYFSSVQELPMIKINNPDGTPNAEGVDTMKAIVAARMDQQLMPEESILDQMIHYSGGCLRDLFLLIFEAAESALDHDRASIIGEDFTKAYHKLKKEYDNNIADFIKDDEVIIPAEDYYKALIELAKNEHKVVNNTQEVMHLRQNLSILGYNGSGWCDVHPIVKDILKDRGHLNG